MVQTHSIGVWQKADRSMANPNSCVSTMEEPSSWVTTSAESATSLYTRSTRKGHTGCLASLSSHRYGRYGPLIKHGQHYCSTWAEQSRTSSPIVPYGLAIGRSLGTDADAI